MQSLKLTKQKSIYLIVMLVVAALIIYLPIGGSRRNINIGILVFIYIALGQSWNLLSGMSGLFSIAHALFYGIGAYGMSLMLARAGSNPLVGLLVGIAANLVVALIVGLVGSKLSGLYFTMALIGIHSIFYTLAGQLTITGGWLGISLPREWQLTRKELYVLGLCMAVLMTVIFQVIRSSRVGTMFVALKENPQLAASLGVNIRGWRILAVLISATMASIAGSFYAIYMMAHNAEVFNGTVSLRIMMVCMVGGVGHIFGPWVGAILIIMDEYIRGAMPTEFASLSVVIYALVLIVMALLRPQGIMGSKIFQPKEIDVRSIENQDAKAEAE